MLPKPDKIKTKQEILKMMDEFRSMIEHYESLKLNKDYYMLQFARQELENLSWHTKWFLYEISKDIDSKQIDAYYNPKFTSDCLPPKAFYTQKGKTEDV